MQRIWSWSLNLRMQKFCSTKVIAIWLIRKHFFEYWLWPGERFSLLLGTHALGPFSSCSTHIQQVTKNITPRRNTLTLEVFSTIILRYSFRRASFCLCYVAFKMNHKPLRYTRSFKTTQRNPLGVKKRNSLQTMKQIVNFHWPPVYCLLPLEKRYFIILLLILFCLKHGVWVCILVLH